MSWERTLVDLVEERTGISLSPDRLRNDVGRRIERRIRDLGLRSPEAWVWKLARCPADDPEFAWLVGTVTVGYSYFFRDAEQLDVVIAVLEELNRGRRGRRALQVWSAGCATGQEPWSLAILAREAGLHVEILGTDLNPDFLDRARAGVYPVKALGRVPDALRPGLAVEEDSVRVREPWRSGVRFHGHNLVGDAPNPMALDGGRFDLILCRNVFIYFSGGVRQRVASRFAASLEPRGWLFLGPGETLEGLDVPLVPRTWGRRLGYSPAPAGGVVRSPTPMPAPARHTPAPAAAVDPLTGLARRVQAGDVEAVERELASRALETGEARLWTALAVLRTRLHRFSAALEACARASAADPLAAGPHFVSGVVHRKRGDSAAAEHSLRQALFLDPEHWPAAWFLAGVHGRLGRDRERRAALRGAREAMGRNPDPTSGIPDFGVESFDPVRLGARIRAELPLGDV